MKPLSDVLGRWIDRVEWHHVVDAAVVEPPGQRLELLTGTDEVDRDGIGIDAAPSSGQLRFDLVGVSVQWLGNAAIFTKEMRRLEAGLDANGEGRGSQVAGCRGKLGDFLL